MNALEIQGLSKRFGVRDVLDGVSFSVPSGSIFGFIGANGAGKTTTMKIILGLLKADGGSVKVCGEQVRFGATNTNRLIGYLPDVPEFYNYMRPKEYLKLCGEIVGLDRKAIKARSTELLELVGLSDANKKIGGFSRGMKQRLGMAQALLSEPKLLICDEPTSALDPVGRKEVLDILQAIKGKTTVVFSTHILSDVERVCDHVAVLNKGKIVLDVAIDDLKFQRKSKAITLEFEQEIDASEVVRLLGEHNMLPARVETAETSIESLLLEVSQ
ncbi:MAG: ABC transporter ATP-binding protein [Oscillospiraceae bacterium]|nr:ABC transporter ATP-binding protein [Oscillospiraceae bacterium]